MAKLNAVVIDLTDTASISAKGNAEKVVGNFSHVSNGNFSATQEALAAYLSAVKAIRRHSHVAELIMFMERSFKGKYLRGERSHYQQIMPTGSWREGDSLSEKLTRCTDKETFKSRFDRIGATAILTRDHFHNFEVSKLDFKGRLYLRLIDTSHNNLSRFYRNDALVEHLIQSALAFYAEQKKTRPKSQGKPEAVGTENPDLTYLENPKPLLTIKESIKTSEKNKGASLTLLHFSSHNNKQQPLPEEGEVKELSTLVKNKMAGSHNANLLKAVSKQAPLHVMAHQSALSSMDVFMLWRQATLIQRPEECISATPTKKLIGQATTFYKKYCEFFPAVTFPQFLTKLNKDWIAASNALKENGVWQNLGNYPSISSLLQVSDKVFSWYKQEHANETEKDLLGTPVKIQSQIEASLLSSFKVIKAPYIDCDMTTAPGRTFTTNGSEESLEYQIAFCSRDEASTDLKELADGCRFRLEKETIDMAASESRIAELIALPNDEFEKYCC